MEALKRVRIGLVADIVVLGVAVWFFLTAIQYPSYAHIVTGVVGALAVLVALMQLLGNFVPWLTGLTHGTKASRQDALAEERSTEDKGSHSLEVRREIMIIGWVTGFMIAIVLLGYVIAVPLFFLVYFIINRPRHWMMAVVSALIMAAVTVGVFDHLLSLSLPGGILTGG